MVAVVATRMPPNRIVAARYTAQLIGSAAVVTTTFVVSLAMFYAINAFGVLRVSREGEMHGLDLHEHGISAYPEYVISALGAPRGMAQELPQASAKAALAVNPLPRAAS
jgi:Amt family ammonium transporter